MMFLTILFSSPPKFFFEFSALFSVLKTCRGGFDASSVSPLYMAIGEFYSCSVSLHRVVIGGCCYYSLILVYKS